MEASTKKLVVTPYVAPNMGPYPENKPPLNKIAFTPVQVSRPSEILVKVLAQFARLGVCASFLDLGLHALSNEPCT